MDMLTRNDLLPWVIDAPEANGGRAHLIEISKHICAHHEAIFEHLGLFYVWQYEMRWAGQALQKKGRITNLKNPKGVWEIRKP